LIRCILQRAAPRSHAATRSIAVRLPAPSPTSPAAAALVHPANLPLKAGRGLDVLHPIGFHALQPTDGSKAVPNGQRGPTRQFELDVSSPPDETLPRLFCVVAPDRADALMAPLREHFAREPRVAVLVDRRTSDGGTRPAGEPGCTPMRAAVAERDPIRALPPELHLEADHLRLVQPLEPVRRTLEDSGMPEIVARSLRNEPEAVSELWWRVSPRVLARLELRLGELADERVASHVLGLVLDDLPTYEPERVPLTLWLDAVVDRFSEKYRHRWEPEGKTGLRLPSARERRLPPFADPY